MISLTTLFAEIEGEYPGWTVTSEPQSLTREWKEGGACCLIKVAPLNDTLVKYTVAVQHGNDVSGGQKPFPVSDSATLAECLRSAIAGARELASSP